jgi:hypothetical protein
MTKTPKLMAITVVLAAAPLVGVLPAHASGGHDAVRDSGSCSGTTHWKLKAKPDSGQLEVEFEVDSNRAGQSWHVRLKDNGSRFFTGTRQTAGASGSFTVSSRTANAVGSDVVKARATHGDEVCRGSVTV